MTTKDEALKLALEAMNLARAAHGQMLLSDPPQETWKAWGVSAALTKAMTAASEALAEQQSGIKQVIDLYDSPEQPAQQEPVTILPDGSAFAVMSYPLPKEHWLYAERQYEEGAEEPLELGKPILTHALRDAVVAAVRYAIRGATNCGKESDFDPDALVQNAVYALCGPFTSPPASKPCEWQREDDIHMPGTWRSDCGVLWTFTEGGPVENDMKHCCGCGAKLREKNA